MARREKPKAKVDIEEEEERRKELESKSSKSAIIVSSSDDDEEANEDLSLKIVEKAMLMRAAKLARGDAVGEDPKDDSGVVEISSSPSQEVEIVLAGPSGGNGEAVEASNKKKIRRKKKKKVEKKIEKSGAGESTVIFLEEEQTAGPIDKAEKVENTDTVEDVGVLEPKDPNTVEISDNIVLRKLLRGARYFDPPDSGWERCYNCGEEGHMAVNCSSVLKRKKPCFVCGSFDHGAKQCSKGQDCFICKKSGHKAKDCPEKQKNGTWIAKICLKCGGSGHDMFSCRSEYSRNDLKEMQCYICKDFGHLCCVNSVNTSPVEVSCYKCGQSGHTGLACGSSRKETTFKGSPSSCYKCGEEGHLARECSSAAKVIKKNNLLSNPASTPLTFHRENKEYLEFKSAPYDLGKTYKRRKTQIYEENGFRTPQKPKQRGGWITEDPADFSYKKPKKNHWRSPATPSSDSYRISNLSYGGNYSSSQSSRNNNFHHRYAASRFGNSGNDGAMRNYNWW